MAVDADQHTWSEQRDLFGEELLLLPPEEETWARVEQVAEDNRDALRHYVELLIWETQENPDLRTIVVSLLWHWDDVDPRWIAEASFMSVGDVRDLAESRPIMIFHCLDCGTNLQPLNRRHLIRMHHSLRTLRSGEIEDGHLADLLCTACIKQRADHAEHQRRLDELRQQALLAQYRKRPYAERRRTREWAILKKQIHRRDGYRCRLCGRDDTELHVHHCTYANYAEERLEDLITLCGTCHQRFHILSDVS
jgi:5-methylcytosine-specific restriction endonuclease McrA